MPVPTERTTYNASNAVEAKSRWTHNARGQTTARCDIDINVGGADSYACGSSTNAPAGVRQWLTSYCEAADVAAPNSTCPILGLTRSVNGPRASSDAGMPGLDDVTTYAYYPSTDESGCGVVGGVCHRKGDLWTMSNALGQVTETVAYDKNGRVVRSKDANGTITDLSYHPRGWLLTRSVRHFASGTPSSLNDATTTFTYDAVGQVTRVTQPDGAYLNYSYDAAHRLTDITDNLSNKIHYTLDAAGNRVHEETVDPGNGIRRALSREYNSLSRLTRSLNASNAATRDSTPFDAAGLTDGYDGNGNPVHVADGLNVETEQLYDPLNRLVKTIQDYAGPNLANTEYTYDARDNLVSVKDPSLLSTTYSYDGLNNLSALDSPDTGHTDYSVDSAGNRLSQTDNRGVTSTYTYDALNRLTAIAYADPGLNVAFHYDQTNAVTGCTGAFPVGRLTGMSDASGDTVYCYDRRGNVLKKTQNGASSLVVSYTYDKADRLATLTYPSGAILTYGRDAIGRITSITRKPDAGSPAVSVVSNASYYPFGPLNQLTYGNGRSLTKTYDQDYAIDQVVSSDPNGLVLDFTTDVMGNIVDASDSLNPATKTRVYHYDRLYRLSEVDTGNKTQLEAYDYNATGDRTNKQLGAQAPQVYDYLAGTHRLGSVDGVERDYDDNGNLVSINTGRAHPEYQYDDRNRMSTSLFNGATLASYTLNGRGERVGKTVPGPTPVTHQFVYDEAGHLLGQYVVGVKLTKGTETLYLDGTPVATTVGGSLSYLETDHLGTPRVAANPATNAQQWKWDFFANAFGDNPATVAPSGGIDVPLRYPGQLFDAETGLHYNYFRDYEPGTGRYVESDPIGLEGGVSAYAYVNDGPIQYVDLLGLQKSFPAYFYANKVCDDGTRSRLGFCKPYGRPPVPQPCPANDCDFNCEVAANECARYTNYGIPQIAGIGGIVLIWVPEPTTATKWCGSALLAFGMGAPIRAQYCDDSMIDCKTKCRVCP